MSDRRWTKRFKNPYGDWRDLSFHTDAEVLRAILLDEDGNPRDGVGVNLHDSLFGEKCYVVPASMLEDR